MGVPDYTTRSSDVTPVLSAAGRWLMRGVDVLVAIFSVVLVVSSRELIEAGMGQVTPATQFRIAYVYVAFPLSAVATLIFVADALRRGRTTSQTPTAAAG